MKLFVSQRPHPLSHPARPVVAEVARDVVVTVVVVVGVGGGGGGVLLPSARPPSPSFCNLFIRPFLQMGPHVT